MNRTNRTIADGPSPYASADETLSAALRRAGYTTSYAPGAYRIIRNGRTVFTSPNVSRTTAWLIRRNRKLAALRGGL